MKQSWQEVFEAFVCKKWNNLQKFNKCTWGIKCSILDHPLLGIHPTFFNNSLMAALIRWPLWASRTRPPGLSWRLSPGYLGLENWPCVSEQPWKERGYPRLVLYEEIYLCMSAPHTHTHKRFQPKYLQYSQLVCYCPIHLHLRHGAGSWPYPLLREGSIPCQFLQQSLPSTLENSIIVKWVGAWQLLFPRIAGSLLTLLV